MEFSLSSRIVGAFIVLCGAVIVSRFHKVLVRILETLQDILTELRKNKLN